MRKKLERPCPLCKGRSKAPCLICGWSKKKRNQLSPKEQFLFDCREEYLKYLLETKIKLRKFNMLTTGVRTVDLEIIENHGDWLTKFNRYEQEFRFRIECNLLEYMKGEGDVTVEEIFRVAFGWNEVPEAFKLHRSERIPIIDEVVRDFILRQTTESEVEHEEVHALV
jgi:hypothetical protein